MLLIAKAAGPGPAEQIKDQEPDKISGIYSRLSKMCHFLYIIFTFISIMYILQTQFLPIPQFILFGLCIFFTVHYL